MVTELEALELLKKYGVAPARIAHCQGVADFAFTLATKIHANHPELPVDPEKVRVAALLHDIGRARDGDHELNSMEILRNEGLGELAKIVIHGSIYEIMLLRGQTNAELLPYSIENKIIAYADARFRDKLVSMKERWREIEERRSDDTEKIKSLHLAKARFFAMEKELLNLAGRGPNRSR